MTEVLSGEARARRKRRDFFRMLLPLTLLGAVTGFALAMVEESSGARMFLANNPVIVALAVGAMALAVGWFSWQFFRKVDEVEVADNLWSSMIGLYVYILLFPAWEGLHSVGLVPPTDHLLIYVVTGLTTVAVYGWRKIRTL